LEDFWRQAITAMFMGMKVSGYPVLLGKMVMTEEREDSIQVWEAR
jgi:hypothetical protein